MLSKFNSLELTAIKKQEAHLQLSKCVLSEFQSDSRVIFAGCSVHKTSHSCNSIFTVIAIFFSPRIYVKKENVLILIASD